MKRVIIASILLLTAVLIAVIGSYTLNKNVNSVISDIKNLEKNLSKNETNQIKEQTEAIFNKWLKIEKTLKILTMQDKISPITEKLNHLSNSHSSDAKELSKNLKEIIVMLEIFLSSEKTVFVNIF